MGRSQNVRVDETGRRAEAEEDRIFRECKSSGRNAVEVPGGSLRLAPLTGPVGVYGPSQWSELMPTT